MNSVARQLPTSRPRFGLIAVVLCVVVLAAGYGGFQLYRAQRAETQRQASLGTPVTGTSAIDITGYAFAVPHLQVRAGSSVTWTNQDESEHNIAFVGGDPAAGPLLAQGATFSQTFDTPGVYEYICQPHPYMIGRITVVE